MRIVISNIIGVVMGIFVFAISMYLLTCVFGFILMIPLVSSLLSWPTTPTLYAAAGINLGSVFMSLEICDRLCLPSQSDKKIGYIILDLLIIVVFGYLFITGLKSGINDRMLSYIFVIVICLFLLRGFDNL